MRSPLLLAIAATASLTSLAPAAFADYPNCFTDPPATPETLTAWRDAALATMPAANADVVKNINTCFPTDVPACLKRPLGYLTRNDIASASLDPAIGDVPARLPPPELLSPGAEGLKYFVPPDIEAVAKAKGWPSVRYKSRHSGGFDSQTSSLLMVYVPGDTLNPPVNFDRWLNFALPADTGADALTPLPQAQLPTVENFANEQTSGADYPRTFTMISLDKATDDQPAEIYFQMFSRNGTNTGVYIPQSNSGVSGCVNCHPNGMRSISPLGLHVRAGEAQLPEDAWNAAQLINEAMDDDVNGRLVSWRGAQVDGKFKSFMKPEAFWPIMGATKPINKVSRSQAFIMGGTLPDGTTTPGCYKRRATVRVTDIFGRPPGQKNIYTLSPTPQINWQNVRNGMLCETCHNNRNRYAINERTDSSTIDYKILVDQSMPLGAHQDPLEQGSATEPPVDTLTPDERIALANCLQAEMAEEAKLLNKWLGQVACH